MAEPLPLWKRYSMRRSWGPFALIGGIGIAVVTALIVVPIVVDLATGGSARLPTDVGSHVTTLTICPSDHDPERWLAAALEVSAHGLPIAARLGPCEGPPAFGEVQARGMGDLVEGFAVELPEHRSEHVVSVGRPIEQAVINMDWTSAHAGTRRGALLHALGLGLEVDGKDGHAGSGVLDRAHGGISWELVERVIAARSADTDGPLP